MAGGWMTALVLKASGLASFLGETLQLYFQLEKQ